MIRCVFSLGESGVKLQSELLAMGVDTRRYHKELGVSEYEAALTEINQQVFLAWVSDHTATLRNILALPDYRMLEFVACLSDPAIRNRFTQVIQEYAFSVVMGCTHQFRKHNPSWTMTSDVLLVNATPHYVVVDLLE